jgi:hypothetical protein
MLIAASSDAALESIPALNALTIYDSALAEPAQPLVSRSGALYICAPASSIRPRTAATTRPSSRGLGRRPFTAKTRVRFPLGAPIKSKTYAQSTWSGRRFSPVLVQTDCEPIGLCPGRHPGQKPTRPGIAAARRNCLISRFRNGSASPHAAPESLRRPRHGPREHAQP